jgi:glycosyltransferase involved in cell wall biosynthesis
MLLYALKGVFEIYNNYKCILVGCGDTLEYDNYLKFLSKKLKIEKNIIFEGYQKNVKKYYENSDFSVLLSVSEGTPYAILESFLYKCPVLASNVGGNHELINNNINGELIEYSGIRDLEKEKIYIINYNEHLEKIGYINNEYVNKIYEKNISFKNAVYIPEQLKLSCNFCYKNDCFKCEYYTKQKIIWEKNVDNITKGIIKMIENNYNGKNIEYANNAYNFFINNFNQSNYVKTILELIE